jgi:pimeloyl-ACP methyl ester carboxylesterase
VKRFAAGFVVAGLLLGGLNAVPLAQAAPSGPPDYTPPPINWGACDIPRLVRAGAECGFVEVPLDYNKPSGTKIQLAVSRVKHKTPDSEAQGPMLVNPGGPGGSGLIYSIFGEFVPDNGGDAYDWIGFDPRGVGSSKPALSCIPDYAGYNRPFYIPITPRLEQTWLQRSKDYAQACDKSQPELLNHLKTVDSVRDMDSIRKALGAPQINYYGFSYGTYLGQVYGTMFPDKFRRVIFDGVVDWKRVWYNANIDQDIAFDKNIKVYFDYIAKHDDHWHLGKTGRDVERLFYSEQAKLLRQPAAGKIGADEWTDIFLQAGYYVYGWVDVADAFAAWVHNQDSAPLIALYGSPPFDDNGYAIYLGVQCTDVQWPLDWNKWRRDNWITFIRAPFETWGNAWFNAPCVYWKGDVGTPVRVDGHKVKNALLISETNDAATPFTGALQARRDFPGSVLIEGVGGTTHAGSLSGVACTDDLITAYLKTGALPTRKPGNHSDVQCDPVPAPQPPADVSKKAAAPSSSSDINSVGDLRREFLKSFRR